MTSATSSCTDGPVITVHKGWASSKKRVNSRHAVPSSEKRHFETNAFALPSRQRKNWVFESPEAETPRISPELLTTKPRMTGQQLEFVNATKPSHTKDPAVRKLVRSHVMRETARGRREQQKKTQLEDAQAEGAKAKDAEKARLATDQRTVLFSDNTNQELLMAPTRAPVPEIGPQIAYHFTHFPTKIGPKTQRLVTLFFSQLAAAMFPMEYHLAYNHIRQVSLVEFSMTDNAVFHALLWIDQVTPPFFHFDHSNRPSLYNLPTYDLDVPTIHIGLRALLPEVSSVFTELVDFSRVVEETLVTRGATLDTKEYVDACYSIQHQLLPRGGVEEDFEHELVQDRLGEAFRVGAIIYVKEILQEFTFSAAGSKIVVAKLRTCLTQLGDKVLVSASAASWLLFWLHVLGGIACGKDKGEREWFLMHLGRMRGRLGLRGWDNVRGLLGSLLWLGKVLDEKGRRLWGDVEGMSGTRFE